MGNCCQSHLNICTIALLQEAEASLGRERRRHKEQTEWVLARAAAKQATLVRSGALCRPASASFVVYLSRSGLVDGFDLGVRLDCGVAFSDDLTHLKI